MANNIRIDLSLTGEQTTARGLENVGDKAEGAGDDFQKMARDAGFLDKRIGELRGEVKGLIAEFNRTGDIDLIKKIGGSNRQLNQVVRLKKQFTDLAGEVVQQAAKIGTESGFKFGESFTKSLMFLRGPGIAALVGLGAASAPFLGAAISSAVLGGTGSLGIIGGVALAARDARVQDEAKKLGEHISEAFKGVGEPFVAPTIQALHELSGVTDKVAADLKQGFTSLAPVFLPLVRGIAGLVDSAMPGFLRGLEAAKPVIRAIANELPAIGQSIGDFFDELGSESDGAIQGFITLSKIIQAAIRGTGQFLAAMSKLYEGIVNYAAKVGPIMEALYGWIPGVGDMIRAGNKRVDEAILGLAKAKDTGGDFAGSLDDIADSATKAREKVQQLNDALDHFFNIAMNSSEATIAYEQAWDDMIEQLSEGKRTLDVATEAGRKNLSSINDTIKGIQGMHQARIDEGMALEQSLAIRDQELEKLRKQLVQLGYNKQQIDDIINLYKLMPELASTTVEAPGAETTISQLREMLSLINALKGGVAVGAVGGIKVGHRASGGPVMAGQSYVVGEHGPELLTMGSNSGHVANAAQTAAMMSGASGGMARPVVNMTFVPSGNATWDALMQALWPYLLKQVRLDGGDLTAFGATA